MNVAAKPTKPVLRPALAAITAAVDQHAADKGIPTLVPTPQPNAQSDVAAADTAMAPTHLKSVPGKKEKGATSAADGPSPTKRLSVDIPDYLRAALKMKSADSDNTIKYIICRAEARDLVEDGRRDNK